MKLSDFDFDLPENLIAQRPAEPREAARLLSVGESLADRRIADLPGLLQPGDLLVVNDTKVIPARLYGRRGEARVEVTLHKSEGPDLWWVFAKPGKRLKPGNLFETDSGLTAEVIEKAEGGDILLRFDRGGLDLMSALEREGEMPLPPYIHRDKGADAQDKKDYQTLFAAKEGAVAAPTAGLHFTKALTEAIEARGAEFLKITLHVGAGTFLPVKAEEVREHKMHAEIGEVTSEAAERYNQARAQGRRIIGVGTTALRLLESACDDEGRLHPFKDETDLFILPGYRFKSVDLLMTNFHLPKSTLFMLVCAFSGEDRMKAAYRHAVEQQYRFFSYGDACLLERAEGGQA